MTGCSIWPACCQHPALDPSRYVASLSLNDRFHLYPQRAYYLLTIYSNRVFFQKELYSEKIINVMDEVGALRLICLHWVQCCRFLFFVRKSVSTLKMVYGEWIPETLQSDEGRNIEPEVLTELCINWTNNSAQKRKLLSKITVSNLKFIASNFKCSLIDEYCLIFLRLAAARVEIDLLLK
ncbi:putative transcription factor COE1 [Trichinella spiralis]|uniref:putative transcription factor COE1 n=1 Tax=Trichinella spiralis TaxID=6334 RepID=UPI0001EFDC02|nr:putative transcription factor COE1 [Trichinella spiralis]